MLKDLPTQGAQSVTGVNSYDGDGKKEEIGAAHRVEESFAAEIAEVKKSACAVRNKRQDTKTDNSE